MAGHSAFEVLGQGWIYGHGECEGSAGGVFLFGVCQWTDAEAGLG